MKKLVYNPNLDIWQLSGQSVVATASNLELFQGSVKHSLDIFSIGEYGCAVIEGIGGTCLFSSPSLKNILGLELDSFSIDVLKSCLSLSEVERWDQDFLSLECSFSKLSQEKSKNYKARSIYGFRHSKKGLRRIYQQVAPFSFDEGRISSYLFIFTDITFLNSASSGQLSFVEILDQSRYKPVNRQLRRAHIHPFSKRELEVLKCMDGNMDSMQISIKLNISRNTVYNHKKSLLKKSGERSSLDLLLKARHLRWV